MSTERDRQEKKSDKERIHEQTCRSLTMGDLCDCTQPGKREIHLEHLLAAKEDEVRRLGELVASLVLQSEAAKDRADELLEDCTEKRQTRDRKIAAIEAVNAQQAARITELQALGTEYVEKNRQQAAQIAELRAQLGDTQYRLGSQLDAAQELLVAANDLEVSPGQYWVTKNALLDARKQNEQLTAALKVAEETLKQAHMCATVEDSGECRGCFVSDALEKIAAMREKRS